MDRNIDINRIVDDYADTIKRICFSYTKNYHDTEDVMQNVFLKCMKQPPFDTPEHEKAWIIRVTINACKDSLRNIFKRHVGLEEIDEPVVQEDEYGYVRDAVKLLPEKYRNVILLFYYEGYTAVEIAGILRKKENTIYTWLSRGKKMLEEQLGGDFFGE